jgi:hypothetical protein
VGPLSSYISERMREKLNSNPLLQVGLVGLLLVFAAIFMFTAKGGGEEEGESATTAEAPAEALETSETAPVAPSAVPALPPGAAASAPPPPRAVTAAFDANQTVALLFVREGGIDDKLVKGAVDSLHALPGVATFVVPAGRISRYAAIAQGVAVDRVPALVVVRPKRLARSGIPAASVSYGFQSRESVVQAVVDAGYKGPTVDYHP